MKILKKNIYSIGSFDKTICIWDAYSGKCLQKLLGHTNNINSIAYSPDGTKIVSGYWNFLNNFIS